MEPTNDEIHQKDIASNQLKPKAGNLEKNSAKAYCVQSVVPIVKEEGKEVKMNSNAALVWQKQVYKRICHKLGLLSEEWEEVQLLKLETENLRKLGKKLLREKFD